MAKNGTAVKTKRKPPKKKSSIEKLSATSLSSPASKPKSGDTFISRAIKELAGRRQFLQLKLERTTSDIGLLEKMQKGGGDPSHTIVQLILNNSVDALPPEMDGLEQGLQEVTKRPYNRKGEKLKGRGEFQELVLESFKYAKAPVKFRRVFEHVQQIHKDVKENKVSGALLGLKRKGVIKKTGDGWSRK